VSRDEPSQHYLAVQATPLIVPRLHPEVFRVFNECRDEIHELTYIRESDEELLAVYYSRPIFEGGESEALQYIDRLKVKPNQLPCLLVEDAESSYLIGIPSKGTPEEVKQEIMGVVLDLATAARSAHSAAELKRLYEAERKARSEADAPGPPPAPPPPHFDWNRFMSEYKYVIMTVALIAVFLFGVPLALALYRVPPEYVAGAFGVLVVDVLVIVSGPLLRRQGLAGPMFLLYAVTGLISAFVLFGVLKSSGVFSMMGPQSSKFEFGGAASVFAFVILMGWMFDRAWAPPSGFAVTFYLHSESVNGPTVKGKGTLQLQLNTQKQVKVKNGFARVAEIPTAWDGNEVNVSVAVKGRAAQGFRVTLAPNAVFHLVIA
jgi:hypothetical protein